MTDSTKPAEGKMSAREFYNINPDMVSNHLYYRFHDNKIDAMFTFAEAYAAYRSQADAEKIERLEAVDDELTVMTKLCNYNAAIVARLTEALNAAGETIHSEICGYRHHPECVKVSEALEGKEKP
jgi:hypothetical protein